MNEEHVNRLLYEGVDAWNAWRRAQPHIRPDLRGATLNPMATQSTLFRAGSVFERFQRRDLQGADLHGADMRSCRIWICSLDDADLRGADLREAEIRRSSMHRVDFGQADLRGTQFLISELNGARMGGAIFGDTHFGATALADVAGLADAHHDRPSQIDHLSIIQSLPLPESFFRACGVTPDAIRMAERHVRERRYRTCFISYRRQDEVLVRELYALLTEAGVPSWFAPAHMRREEVQGTWVELQRDLYTYIDAAECVLLVMSPSIIASAWIGLEIGRRHSDQTLRPKPIIPLLIETMPEPGSPAWVDGLTKAASFTIDGQYSPLNVQQYSEHLAELVRGPHLDFRACRDPRVLRNCLPPLLELLKRSP
jgi:hypothetical protein